MSQSNENCKSRLAYEKLSDIESDLLSDVKRIFIFTKYDASDVIFVTNSDEVYGYGTNKFGRLGFGHNNAVLKPSKIPELCDKSIINVEFGQQIMGALTESMEVYVCGYLSDNYDFSFYKPQKINLSGKLVFDIKCCSNTIYLLTAKKVYYGSSDNIIWSTTLMQLSVNNNSPIAISCGTTHILTLTDTGKVYAWGENRHGQLGLDHKKPISSPQLIDLGEDIFIKQISCGNIHSLLLSTDGHIYSFGKNNCGQLGGDLEFYILPKPMYAINKVIEIFAFGNASMALTESNNVLVWGESRDGNYTTTTYTNKRSIQEAINDLSKTQFTYKPLSSKEIFRDISVNPVLDTMAKAFNEEKFSDFKFKLKRGDDSFGYIYGHKWFIAKASEHFERMFANNWSENNSNEIEIKEYSYKSYYQLIRCLYTDSIETEDIEVLMELLAITDEYLEDRIKTKCIRKIKPLMKVGNVCSLYCSALRNRSKELEEYCFEFMSKYMSSIVETEDFDQLDGNYAKHFLTLFVKLPKIKSCT